MGEVVDVEVRGFFLLEAHGTCETQVEVGALVSGDVSYAGD
jgi:hypothetical protein